jgi:hypothetical protein
VLLMIPVIISYKTYDVYFDPHCPQNINLRMIHNVNSTENIIMVKAPHWPCSISIINFIEIQREEYIDVSGFCFETRYAPFGGYKFIL